MFFMFLAILFFLLAFSIDKMQLYAKLTMLETPKAPMVWGGLNKILWKFSGPDIQRWGIYNFFWGLLHLIVIGAVYDYLKIGPKIHPSGIIPTIIVALVMGIFYGQLFLRRKKV